MHFLDKPKGRNALQNTVSIPFQTSPSHSTVNFRKVVADFQIMPLISQIQRRQSIVPMKFKSHSCIKPASESHGKKREPILQGLIRGKEHWLLLQGYCEGNTAFTVLFLSPILLATRTT
jgi:hypothetical protein